MKLRNRVLGAFIVVITVAVMVMAFTAHIYIRNIFDRYTAGYRNTLTAQWEYLFGAYYLRYGTWEGIENIFLLLNRGRMLSPHMMMEPMRENFRGILPGDRLILADKTGAVVLDSQQELIGEKLSREELQKGTEIIVAGEKAGTLLLMPRTVRAVQTLEELFSRSVILAVLWAAAVALLTGAVLSFIITGQIARPIAQLTASAKRFARRDFQHRVKLSGNDEIGKLAEAFNLMAESIEKNEKLRHNLMIDIAHELRTPLTVLRGNLESLQAGIINPDPELLTSLHDEVLRLSRLISDLEAVNLAEAGKLPLHFKEVNPASMLSRAAAAFQHEVATREINFQVEVEKGLKNRVLDEDRILQVLINLLANAFKFTPDKGEVTLRAREENERLVVEITDSGPGIPEKDLPYIFERFYKSSRSRSGGSGLGLSIAKSFVEAHGGQITAANRPEGGSIFTFYLPQKS